MLRVLVLCSMMIMLVKTNAQPRVFIMNANRLVDLKNKIKKKDKAKIQLVDSLKKRADVLLQMKPVSVMDKEFTPVSGSKHDYMSQAPYFWYDSSKPKGLPYLRRDGVRNPEINKITDKNGLVTLETASKTLALAYYFTGEEIYAEKAAILLRYWFFNDETKMNPNLEYAQGIPGVNHGRGIGIIESRSFTGIADAVGLLHGSPSWKADDEKKLNQWYVEFLNWMLSSKNGKDEHAAKNNHGTWFFVQAIDYALFTGNKTLARSLAEESKARLDSQLAPDGSQPLELDRTKGLGYSTMNLRGWFEAATLAEQEGIDLWNYKTSKGASLRTALDWLKPYALGEKKWQYQQIEKYDRSELYPILLQAAYKFQAPEYLQSVEEGKGEWMMDLLYRK
ncbi:MAG: alginate lyase family protein [Flavisolibacter sp.]